MLNKMEYLKDGLIELFQNKNVAIDDVCKEVFNSLTYPEDSDIDEVEHRRSKFKSFLNQDGDYIPQNKDIARISIFLKISMYEALLLMVKTNFELFFVIHNQKLISEVKETEFQENQIANFKNSILKNESISDIFNELSKVKYLNKDLLFSTHHIANLIHQAISQRVFLFSLKSEEAKNYIRQAESIENQLKNANDVDSKHYIQNLKIWLQKNDDAENLHWQCENQRMLNSKTEQEWMKTFGQEYIKLLERKTEVLKLERMLSCKKENPGYSLQQIEELEKDFQAGLASEFENSMMEFKYANNILTPEIEQINQEQQKEIADRYKKILREIYKKTAPDIIDNYNFTQEQKDKLVELYRRAVDLRPHEKGYDLRNNEERLLQTLSEVNAIWESMGLDIRVGFVIQGSTIPEMTDWLKKQILILESEIRSLSAMLLAIAENKDIKEKKISLSDADIVNAVKENMKEQLEKYEIEYQKLKHMFDGYFKDTKPNDK